MKRSRKDEFALRDQLDQSANDGPAFARALQKHPVVQACGHQHQREGQAQANQQQLGTTQMYCTAFGKPSIRDNQMHLYSFFTHPRMTTRRHQSVTLLQATQESPMLARLSELSKDSVARLKAIEAMIPVVLRPAVTAGPIDGSNWCLIVNSNAAAAKIRQLLPAMEAHLRTNGWQVTVIRLKVQIPSNR
jgi:hypothetical protein